MNMGKRVRLFIIGVILGSIIMYFFVLKDRNIYLGPEEVIITKIQEGKPKISSKAKCKMDCYDISAAEIKLLLENADIDFSASDVHGKPCKTYIINNEDNSVELNQVTFQLCDTVIILSNIEVKSKKTCDCEN